MKQKDNQNKPRLNISREREETNTTTKINNPSNRESYRDQTQAITQIPSIPSNPIQPMSIKQEEELEAVMDKLIWRMEDLLANNLLDEVERFLDRFNCI